MQQQLGGVVVVVVAVVVVAAAAVVVVVAAAVVVVEISLPNVQLTVLVEAVDVIPAAISEGDKFYLYRLSKIIN